MRADVRALSARDIPGRGAIAVAGIVGIVVGAVGGPIVKITGLGLLVLIAFGVWRAVMCLAALVDLLDLPPAAPAPACAETVDIHHADAETVVIRR